MLAGMTPDFICIGAQKAGTTWLYRQLRAHPDAWLPPVKELHYFDRDAHAKRHGLLDRLAEAGTRHAFAEWLNTLYRHRQPGDLAWGRRYFTGRRDDDWYGRLFAGGAGRLTGEFTPAYSAMTAAGVRHVARVAPGARIIFLLRNPVDRAWSHAVMNLCRFTGRSVDEVDDAEFLAHFDSPGSRLRGDYLGALARWEGNMSPDRIRVLFFDEMVDRPEALLDKVFNFLGLDTYPRYIQDATLRTGVNPGGYCSMPGRIEHHLSSQYFEAMKAMADRLGGPALEWLQRAEATLDER